MKYDYLIVGSGLYGTIFAHEAKTHGKTVLVVDKRPNIAGNIYTKKLKESMSINMARIFSIPITKKYGIISRSLQSSTVLPTLLLRTIRANSTRCPSTCIPLIRCGAS